MRKLTALLLLLFAQIALAQNVGINTTTPRKTLEVAGDVLISGSLDLQYFNKLSNADNSTFLKQESDGALTSLNVSNSDGAALGYIQEFEIINMDGDWVFDFDTTISASDYVVIPISSNYNQSLYVSTSFNAEDNFSIQYCSTFISNNTWHLIADYPVASNFDDSVDGVWKITTLIFSRNLSKQFGVSSHQMNESSTGAAPTPILD